LKKKVRGGGRVTASNKNSVFNFFEDVIGVSRLKKQG
jgi:hypothetical protein